MALLCRA